MAAKKNNQPMLIALAVAAAGGLIYFVTKKKNTEVVNLEPEAELPEASTPTKPATTTPAVTINKNLTLKKGSTGNEVKELQKLLGVTADGIFGSQTEATLYQTKGVKQITLAQYGTLPSINQGALPDGTTVKSSKVAGTPYYPVQGPQGDGSFITEGGNALGTVAYGNTVGKIVAKNSTKARYVIQGTNWLGSTTYFWVAASDVVKV